MAIPLGRRVLKPEVLARHSACGAKNGQPLATNGERAAWSTRRLGPDGAAHRAHPLRGGQFMLVKASITVFVLGASFLLGGLTCIRNSNRLWVSRWGKLSGLDVLAVERILSEIALDMSRWPRAKHFYVWLNVAPNNRISGGKMLSSRRRKNANRALAALRLAARAPCKVKRPSVPSSDALRRVSELQQPSTPEPTNSPAYSTACSSSARLTSRPDSKPTKSSSKNALSATFSAGLASLASTSLPSLPPL